MAQDSPEKAYLMMAPFKKRIKWNFDSLRLLVYVLIAIIIFHDANKNRIWVGHMEYLECVYEFLNQDLIYHYLDKNYY